MVVGTVALVVSAVVVGATVAVRAGVVVVVFEPLTPRATSKKAVRKKTGRITIITKSVRSGAGETSLRVD